MPRSNGFTLVEVLVAMVIAGLGISAAVSVFGIAGDSVARLDREGQAWSRAGNARAWMAEAFTSAEVDPLAGIGFDGGTSGVRFRGWQWTPEGWVEPTDITISYAESTLKATTSAGQPIILADSIADARFEYLATPGGNTVWSPGWRSDTDLPAAIQVRIERGSAPGGADTLLFLVGAGG